MLQARLLIKEKMSVSSPVIYFAVLSYSFAPWHVFILRLLNTHDIPQLGARQFPVFVLCLKT